MKTPRTFIILFASTIGVLAGKAAGAAQAATQEKTFTLKIDNPENGSIKLDPIPPDDGKVPSGTVITVTATPPT